VKIKGGFVGSKRFRIAFSFAGEKRDFVLNVATILAQLFGEDAILYDKFHKAEFSRSDLAFYLTDLYKKNADLIVVVFSLDYEKKEWCGLEWNAIYSLLKARDACDVMLTRFDRVEAKHLFDLAGYLDLDDQTPESTATHILERLAINEGFQKKYYSHQLDKIIQQDYVNYAVKGNPFQTAGAVPHDHPTYIRRPSDDEFEKALAGPDRLISITGEYGIGKSSLMHQTRRILSNHYFFGGGLADMRSDNPQMFIKCFFKLFSHRFGVVEDWDHLDEHLHDHPSVLFLDDLGEVAAPGLGALIPALIARLTKPDAKLRAITTSPKSLRDIFDKRDLGNPKYSKPWKNIQVEALQEQGVRQLLQLLPPRCYAQAMTHFREIEQRSQYKPQRLQCLCSRLFDAEYNGSTEMQLSALIKEEASYE
jgi:hypothetical protein